MISVVILAVLALVCLSREANAHSSDLFIISQDSTRKAVVERIGLDGSVLARSSESFSFSWPLIEITTDSQGQLYAITYPDNAPGAVLYLFDEKLNVVSKWSNVPFSYFDLQYAPLQSTLFGIYVTSTYGRALSYFEVDAAKDSVVATQLFTLPYMWYVNASTINTRSSTYFGLINNFPNQPNSTDAQQLVVGHFTDLASPRADVVPLSTPFIVQFVAFSQDKGLLFCAGKNVTTVTVGVLDSASGALRSALFHLTAVAVGPLAADVGDAGALTVFVKATASSHWDLWLVPYSGAKATVTHTFTEEQYAVVAAGARAGPK